MSAAWTLLHPCLYSPLKQLNIVVCLGSGYLSLSVRSPSVSMFASLSFSPGHFLWVVHVALLFPRFPALCDEAWWRAQGGGRTDGRLWQRLWSLEMWLHWTFCLLVPVQTGSDVQLGPGVASSICCTQLGSLLYTYWGFASGAFSFFPFICGSRVEGETLPLPSACSVFSVKARGPFYKANDGLLWWFGVLVRCCLGSSILCPFFSPVKSQNRSFPLDSQGGTRVLLVPTPPSSALCLCSLKDTSH